jgi:hypothetical protein
MRHDTGTAVLEFTEHMDVISKVTMMLKSSEKKSQICFRYQSPEELIQMQASLIEFGRHLLDMKDWVQECARPLYYDMLTLLLLRGELDLGNMTTKSKT